MRGERYDLLVYLLVSKRVVAATAKPSHTEKTVARKNECSNNYPSRWHVIENDVMLFGGFMDILGCAQGSARDTCQLCQSFFGIIEVGEEDVSDLVTLLGTFSRKLRQCGFFLRHPLKHFPKIGMLLDGSLDERVADGEETFTECGGRENQMVLHAPHPDIDGEFGRGMVCGH